MGGSFDVVGRCRFRVAVSDCSCEFVERGSHRQSVAGVNAEFVVAASKVPHERVTPDHHRGGPVAFQAPHGSEPALEAAVVGFDPVVGVLRGVVVHASQQLDDGASQPPATDPP